MPAYDELILIAKRAKLADPRLGRFLDAVEKGVQYLVNHPDESFKLFVKGRPELDDGLNRRAWADTVARFALRPAALDHARYAPLRGLPRRPGPDQTAAPGRELRGRAETVALGLIDHLSPTTSRIRC